jgi:hypothetical protein
MEGFDAVEGAEFLLKVEFSEFRHHTCHLSSSVEPPVGGFVVLGAGNKEATGIGIAKERSERRAPSTERREAGAEAKGLGSRLIADR